jgi:hypothetical protein
VVLPNLLVIGAQKAGTTSLWAYLNEHPEIFMAQEKELHFFDRPRNWSRGAEWYSRQFTGWSGEPVIGEATPAYTRFPQFTDVPRRAFEVVPKARLIYVVRNPVDRIRSQYLHERGAGFERDEFAHAVLTNPMYVNGSRYCLQIDQWLEYFPRESLLVLTSEQLLHDGARTMAQVYDFLDVDATWVPTLGTLHRTGTAPARPTTIRRLQSTYAGQLLKEHAPPRLRRCYTAALRGTIDRPVSTSGAQLDPGLAEKLRDLVRDDVHRLREHLPAGFDGWGL